MARDYRIDSIKGLLIILVVIGHVITMLNNTNAINHGVMGGIYIFHMPLFILLSGYLTKSPEQQSPGKMWRGVGNIAITFIIFQVISCIRVTFYGGNFWASMSYFPFGILWYLFSLMLWRIMLYYTPRALLRKTWLYLGLAFLASVLIGLTNLGLFLSIQRTFNFYVFFLLGYYYRQGCISTKWWNNNLLHGIITIVLLPLIFWLFPRCGNVMNGADHYDLVDIPQKVMILACSISISLLVFNLMRDFRPLRSIGQHSMFYYLYHIYIIGTVLSPLVKQYHWPSNIVFVLLYSTAIIAALSLLRKIKFFRWLVQPWRF